MLYLLRVASCPLLDLVLVLLVVLLLTADEASAQISVQVSEGDDALLPCARPKGPPPANMSVYWKDKHDDQVLTIRNYTDDPRNQSPRYQNRVRSFQQQYTDGNYSLVLMKVNGSDSGEFECLILPEEIQQNVRLSVTGKRESPGSGLLGPEVGGSGPSSGDSVASPHHLLLLLHLPLLLLVRL